MGQVNLQPPQERDDYEWLDNLAEDVLGRMRVIHALETCDKLEEQVKRLKELVKVMILCGKFPSDQLEGIRDEAFALLEKEDKDATV